MAWNDVLSRMFGGGSAPSAGLLGEGQEHWWGNSLGGLFGATPDAGVSFSQEQAMSVSTVYACTRARSEILASLPPMVYLEVDDNARRRDTDNSLWPLLHDSPNPEMDSMVFYELVQARAVNRGNGFALIERDNMDLPIALWPVHNSRVEPFRDRDDGSLMWRIYHDKIDHRTERYVSEVVPDRNMLNIRGYGGNGYIGRGVVPTAVEEISLNMAMTRYGSRFFKQGGKPIGVVEHPGWIDDRDKRREFRSDVNTLHSGAENWHKVATLWQGAKWKEMQFSPEQSQFIAGRNFSGKQICSFYNVPPALVQIFEDYKFATVDAMIQQFVMTCVRSDAIRWERAIQSQVLRTRDSRNRVVELFENPYVFEFVIEALLRGNAKTQAETLEIERRNGIINANQWRALSNREGIGEQGEKYILPGGFEDLDKLGENGGSDSSGASGSSADASLNAGSLPYFDREFVAKSLESGVPKHRDRSVGGGHSDATTVRDELDKAALSVLAEAVERVGKITQKELVRAEQSKDSSRVDAVWTKHKERLESAILPACEIYCRYRDLDAGELAERISAGLADRRSVAVAVSAATFAA